MRRSAALAAFLLVLVASIGASYLVSRQAKSDTAALARRLAIENRTALVQRCENGNRTVRAPANRDRAILRAIVEAAIVAHETTAATAVAPRERRAELLVVRKFKTLVAELNPQPIPNCSVVIPSPR